MLNNWKTYKLEKVATLQRGFDLPNTKRNDGKYPVIAASGFSTWHNEFKVKAPGVTTGRSGTLGQVHYVKDDFWPLNTSLWVKDFNGNDERFIYYFLQTLNFEEYNSGTSVPTLNRNDVHKLDVTIPDMTEQQSIASILSAIDDKIENNLAINKTLEEMAMALYKHWFVDFGPFKDSEFVQSELGMIPKGWEVKRLDELADFTNGYAFKSGDLKIDNDGNSYHIFKMGHIERGGGLKENATKSYINKLKCAKLEKYILKVGDLLMAMTDMKDNVAILGNTALINENDKYIVNQRVGLIRPKNNLGIDYSFLFLTTNENSFIERLRSQANSGVQVNLSTEAIKSAKMIIGSKAINTKFDELVNPLYNNIFQNKIENQTLTQLRDTLLPKLISGEVRLKEYREN